MRPFSFLLPALALSTLLATPLTAATFTVDSTFDAVDVNPGDGTCADSVGDCTLRAAIMEANALAGADSVVLPAGTYRLTIPGYDEDASVTGDLDITASVTISGASAETTVIDGFGLKDRAFDIRGGVVVIRHLTLQHAGSDTSEGGGIRNAATLSVEDSEVTTGVSGGTTGIARGGGIANRGTLTIERSRFRMCGASAYDAPGENTAQGGAVWNAGTLSVSQTTFHLNHASARGSFATALGGAIYSADTETAQMTVTSSTFMTNNVSASVMSQGGAIYAGGAASITNCTFTTNYASGEPAPTRGGAIAKVGAKLHTYTNLTITHNEAAGGSGVFTTGGVQYLNTALVGNRGTSDCFGAGSSAGYNILGSSTCVATLQSGDIVGSPTEIFYALADNGGPTLTYMPRPGSIAIDAGSPTSCVPTDQRGALRPGDGNFDGVARCDIGAVEYCTLPAISGPSSLLAGSNVRLTIPPGALSQQWYRNGIAIPGATGETLFMANIAGPSHGGVYTVIANYGCGTSQSLEFNLSVRDSAKGRFLFWRHGATGQVYLWELEGPNVVAVRPLETVADMNWKIVGSGDVDADGDDDLVWQHAVTGEVYFWLVNAGVTAVRLANPPSTSWHIAAVGDFDGDSRIDLLWQHTTGSLYVWLLDGTTMRDARPLTNTESMQLVGVGDLDDDGTSDLIWNHPQAMRHLAWKIRAGRRMPDTTSFSWLQRDTIASGWALTGIGDTNGDRIVDLIWSNSGTSSTYLWPMQGLLWDVASAPLPSSGGFTLAVTADYDHDGRTDLVWRHPATGANYLWQMNGANAVGTPLPSVSDLQWQIVAPLPRGK